MIYKTNRFTYVQRGDIFVIESKKWLGKRLVPPSQEIQVIQEIVEGANSMRDRLELLKYEHNMLRSLVILDAVRFEVLKNLGEETGVDPSYLYKLPYERVLKLVISSLVEIDKQRK